MTARPLPMPATTAPPLLSVRNLSVERGGTTILRGVSADIARGAVTALIGLNGSGKSTLLRVLLGEFPYRGQLIYSCGHDHSKPRPEHIGYVPQRLSIDPRLPITVHDLMGLALANRPIFLGLGAKRSSRIRELLVQVGCENLLNVPVDGLSGGQLQRVLLALALEPGPEFLLLDEPAAGIDFKTQQAYYELIADLNHRLGITILLVSHDLTVVNRFAKHVLCLRDGVIHCEGAPDQILSAKNLAEVYGHEMQFFAHVH